MHHTTNRMLSLTSVAWQVLVYWVLLGLVGGYYLYRPDFEPTLLQDDDGETSELKRALLVVCFFVCEFLNAYQHYRFSEIEDEMSNEIDEEDDQDAAVRRAYIVHARATEISHEKHHRDIVACADVAWTASFGAFLVLLQVVG